MKKRKKDKVKSDDKEDKKKIISDENTVLRIKSLKEKLRKDKKVIDAIKKKEDEQDKDGVYLPITLDDPTIKNNPFVKVQKKNSKLKFWDKKKLEYHADRSFLIKMLNSNGTSKEFIISTSEELFRYRKRWYHLNHTQSYFNLTQNQHELTFFDDYVEPLDKDIVCVPVQRKTLMLGKIPFHSVTPDNIQPILSMQYVKVLASSGELDKHLKMTATLQIFMIAMIVYLIFQISRISKWVKIIGGALA